MFYSHELLTNKKYGVATVWLVATVGGRSSAKRVSRKAILEVNVRKACTTIMEPEAPMALRLQSNLLYGVSRVYDQQCGYVLADAQSAQHALRALVRVTNDHALDVNAGKARPDQLMLEDDPAFIPDMNIPPLDFDFSGLVNELSEFQMDSQKSMLSPRSPSGSHSSSSRHSILLDIHSSTIGSYQLPLQDPFQASSTQKVPMGRIFEEEEQLLLDDFDFGFDAEGNIREFGADERNIIDTGSFPPKFGRLESDSAVSGRVHLENEEAIGGYVEPKFDADGDFIMQFDDEANILPDAAPFSPKTASRRKERDLSASPIVEESSSDVADAQLRAPRKRRVAKKIDFDQQLEYRNSDLARWNQRYIQNMEAAKQEKQKKAATALAKTNAQIWVFGNGIGNIGRDFSRFNLVNPLDVFTGDKLMATITGEIPNTRVSKRSHISETEEERNVRPRPDVDEDNVGRDVPMEEDFMIQFDDSNVELGRDAPHGLADHQSSAMPWNISASVHSFRSQAPGSISIGFDGRGSSVQRGRPGSRLTSASPLLGRGSNVGGPILDIERFDSGVDDFPMGGGFSSSIGADIGRGRTLTPLGQVIASDEFEMFGPAAAVDTQTAAQSQWVKEALANEAINFLEYVKNSIIEADVKAGEDNETDDLAKELGVGEVGFETLFPPENNTAMVAAQAFHHVLTLATKKLLAVHQEEMWGEINMRII